MQLPPPLQDTVGVVALAGLLVTAHRHPRPRTEALLSVVAAGVVLACGLVGPDRAWDAVDPLLPVVGFLVSILVVAEVCARAGLFARAADVVRRHSVGADGRARPQALLLGVFAVAVLTTTVLSLDATVVLLTPVVLVAARRLGTSPRPAAYACLRMANSGSLLLPVSNLTNLLAMPHLPYGFGGFAARMALPLGATLLVEYAGLRLLFRRDLSPPATVAETGALAWEGSVGVPLAVVALMLVGFGALSPLGVDPCWPAGAAAVVLLAWSRHRRLLGGRDAARAAHPSFVLFVLALGVVVAGLADGFLGDVATHLLPDGATFVDLLLIAVIATLAAALLTNLSATLLLVPLLAPAGGPEVLAALLGLGIGAGLTWTGSLANLLWRRTLVRQGIRPDQALFHRVSLLLTPVSLVAATAVLAAVT
ncbi:SLC13 family permease [Nocardioides cheoyonin]|uniref:SLC13 family permease n=1 Tax=Nocardioides cheoyonin TaxID=3156615 RepID=UPI0032B4F559